MITVLACRQLRQFAPLAMMALSATSVHPGPAGC
nr:MAG TPA: hypothetical protein [Caudoviricetes sp.]